MKRNILVIGSSNTDMVIKSPHMPRVGETIIGGDFLMNPGGKGANQAVAAAKWGGRVTFMAKVGDDVFGDTAIKGFKAVGIDTTAIQRERDTPSGVALIMVGDDGDNSISVALGANEKLSAEDIEAQTELFKNADIVLLQLEIPLQTVARACEMAHGLRKRVILNPAPAQNLSESILKSVFLLTPNETEAELLTGIKVEDEKTAREAAGNLRAKGVANVIITMGAAGAYLSSDGHEGLLAAPKVNAIDGTAAGDTFNGALAVAIAEGSDLQRAVVFANKAAAFSVTRLGAQSSTPTREDIA